MAVEHTAVSALQPGDLIMVPQRVIGIYPTIEEGDPDTVWLKTDGGIFMQTNRKNTVHRIKKAGQ